MGLSQLQITSAGSPSVIGLFSSRPNTDIPAGFAKVCVQQGWSVESTWKQLSDSRDWFESDNGAYIYYNKGDGHWWIDEPGGAGVYVASRDTPVPPSDGWKPLGGSSLPLPNVVPLA